MEYRKFENHLVVRIDRGEEILTALKKVAQREQILLASVQGLGAINDFTVGVFYAKEKEYKSNRFQGNFEIVSLTGTVNTMDGKYYSHLHMSAANEKGEVYGGHLNEAIVSATCELVISFIHGTVDRKYSEEIGLNLYHFDSN